MFDGALLAPTQRFRRDSQLDSESLVAMGNSNGPAHTSQPKASAGVDNPDDTITLYHFHILNAAAGVGEMRMHHQIMASFGRHKL